MKSDHPKLTPPPELRRLWAQQAQRIDPSDPVQWMQYVSEKAAQWGADQELEACCEYLVRCAQWEPEDVNELRAARRPKPPSLKEQALAELKKVDMLWDTTEFGDETLNSLDTIRRALEVLDE
jgi:hypothetical protein